MSLKILIVDEMHPSLFEMLDGAGFSYDYQPLLKRVDILDKITGYEGLIIRSKTPIDEEFLQCATSLRFIARAGAGLDLIDIEAVQKRNIRLFAANEGNKDSVGEQVIGMLLSLMTNVAKANREVKNRIWNREDNRGYELMGKTVGIVGYGFNGRATAKKLSGFDCKVLAYDKLQNGYGNEYATEATMTQIFEEADVLSLHIPLTEDTKLMIDDAFINQFRKPFFLINISRGEIVNLQSVVNGLENGKVRGACLDVLENEKLNSFTPEQERVFDYLAKSDRVILTPHIAGWTYESYVKINEVLVKQIREVFH